MTVESIAENYHKYFRIRIADTEDLRNETFGVRYRVYAEEFGFESIDEFPDQKESDEFDHQSIHCLITHRSTGDAAGCVRLVPTFSSEVRDPLPLEKYCSSCLDMNFIKAMAVPRESMCEISRLAVDGKFRQRPGERKTRLGSVDSAANSPEELRTFPLIAVSAFFATISLTQLVGRPNMFMMTEPFLPRLLSRYGIMIERAGHDMDYHGVRAPYYLNGEQAAHGIKSELRELYSSIYEQFKNYASTHEL